MGTLWPQNWKKLSFLLVTVPFLHIESSVIPPLKAFYEGLHFFLIHWWAMNNIWGHYDLKAWKFDNLTVLCAVWFTLSVPRDLFLKPWVYQHLLTFKVNVKVKLESFSILVIIIIPSFPNHPLLAKISETAMLSVTKLHTHVDPYLLSCTWYFSSGSGLSFWI